MIQKNEQKKAFPFGILIFLIVFTSIIAFSFYKYRALFLDADGLAQIIQDSGPRGPILLILLHVIQNIVFFIPGPFVSIAGGYVFGFTWGFVYNMIGTMTGSSLLFLLSRKLGKAKIEEIIHEDELNKINNFIKQKGKYAIFYSRALPMFPGDIATMFLGLTEIPFRDFFVLTFLGNIPRLLVENVFGNELRKGIINPALIILSLALTILFVFSLFFERIYEWIKTKIRK